MLALAGAFASDTAAMPLILIGIFVTLTTPVTLILLARAALHRDRSEGRGVTDTDKSEDVTVPLASPAGDLTFSYQVENERVYAIEFRMYPDEETGLLAVLGALVQLQGAWAQTAPAAAPPLTIVAAEASKWGAEWIVFPNASYGTWSKAPLQGWDAKTVIEAW